MAYRWKPNASQRKAYAERMREQESISFINSNGPIRSGCKVSWIDKSSSEEFSGIVVNSSYGSTTNQHTFTILLDDDSKKLVKGRNLYDRLIKHIPGDISLNN